MKLGIGLFDWSLGYAYREQTVEIKAFDSSGTKQIKGSPYMLKVSTLQVKDIDGNVYNEFAISNPKQICPQGWHNATEAEWVALINAAGGLANAVNTLRAKNNWVNLNGISSDSFVFSIQPAGFIGSDAAYYALNLQSYFWGDRTKNSKGPFFTAGAYMFFPTTATPLDLSCRSVMDN